MCVQRGPVPVTGALVVFSVAMHLVLFVYRCVGTARKWHEALEQLEQPAGTHSTPFAGCIVCSGLCAQVIPGHAQCC